MPGARRCSADSAAAICGPAASRTAPAPHVSSATPISSAPTVRSADAMRSLTSLRIRSLPSGTGSADHRYTVLTGGEPLLQIDTALIDALHARGFHDRDRDQRHHRTAARPRLDLRQPQGRRGTCGPRGPRAEAGLSAGGAPPGGLRRSRLRAVLVAADGRT